MAFAPTLIWLFVGRAIAGIAATFTGAVHALTSLSVYRWGTTGSISAVLAITQSGLSFGTLEPPINIGTNSSMIDVAAAKPMTASSPTGRSPPMFDVQSDDMLPHTPHIDVSTFERK
jgi:hypothetical protein